MTKPAIGKVLVTGASGFIGRALCSHLVVGGIDYVAAVRAIAPDHNSGDAGLGCGDAIAPDANWRSAQLALGDFAAAEWRGALSGVDAIVHLAGRAPVPPGRAADAPTPYIVANVHVSRRLAEAAVRAGVRRIVFTSSVKVYGEANKSGRPFRVGDVDAPEGAYARSKAEAERVLRDICGAHGVEVVILRLPLTYGPGVKGNFRTLLEALASGRRLPLAGIANRRSLLYIYNAVSAIETALLAPVAPEEALPIADAEVVSTSDLATRLAHALRVKPRLFHVPAAFLRGSAALIGRGTEVSRLLDSLEVDASRFRELTGWSPPDSLDEGLAATAAWWQLQHAP